MRKHWLVTAAVALAALAGTVALAQGSKGSPEDEKAVRETLAAYDDAFVKGDAAAFGALFAQDAEFVAGDGQHVKGRDALVKRMQDYHSRHEGDRIHLTATAVRFLSPEVAQVEGNAEVRGPEGDPDVSPYLAVLVKQDGKWLFDSVRDLSTESDEEAVTPAERLEDLAWMVGDWRQSGGGTAVQANCRWDKNHNFLLWDYTLKVADEDVMTVSQRIGWDPQAASFRSWIFDSQGGYAQGRWTQLGNTWTILQTGVLPDGGSASATALLTPNGTEAFSWKMTNRQVAGEKLADLDLRFTRVGGR